MWPFPKHSDFEPLKPCPFCGNTEPANITVPAYETPDMPPEVIIGCGNCGAEVSSKNTRHSQLGLSARETWNQRA